MLFKITNGLTRYLLTPFLGGVFTQYKVYGVHFLIFVGDAKHTITERKIEFVQNLPGANVLQMWNSQSFATSAKVAMMANLPLPHLHRVQSFVKLIFTTYLHTWDDYLVITPLCEQSLCDRLWANKNVL